MAGVISVGGLATGLDTNSIIDKLVALERRPVDLLEQQIAAIQATKSSVSSVQSNLATLRGAAQALGTTDGVLIRTAKSSDESAVSAVAGAGAARGAVEITVGRLARGSVAGATVGVASATATVAGGAGTFEFQVGSGAVQSVAVDGTTTLQGLADSINALGAGVTATAVNLGTSATPDYRLEIVSQSTGASSTVTVTHDGTTLGVQTTQAGLDAQFTVAGFAGTFTRETNTFSDVLAGVTFNLNGVGTSTVTVSDDPDKIVDQIKSLVTSFNDLVSFVAGESNVTETKDKSDVSVGTLATDSTVKGLLTRLHDVFSQSLTGASTKYVNLSSLGLATQQDGTIKLDEAKLRAAVSDNPNAVAQVFAGNGTATGVANDLATVIGDATSAGGLLAKHTTSLDDQIRSLQNDVDAGQRRVDAFQANLEAQFTALESLVSGLQSQSGFVLSAIAGAGR
jgi:flagellar hook-associated protein 2